MTETKELITVKTVTNTETGDHVVGEIDFGISGNLRIYLKKYGIKGRDNIVKTLSFLNHMVYKTFDEVISDRIFRKR